MEKPSVGVCILAGGQSSRMGEDKARLSLPGEQEDFLTRLGKQMNFFQERLISIRDCAYDLEGFTPIEDLVERIGPLGGIYSALKQCESDALLVLACDMPFFTKACGLEMLEAFQEEECQIALCMSQEGMEPLASIYSKECIPFIEKHIQEKNYRLRTLFEECVTKKVWISDSKCVRNINTRQDLENSYLNCKK